MSTASNRASKLLEAAKSALEILEEQENSRGFPNVVASKLRAAIQESERLVAAAPELLEALLRCELWLRTHSEGKAMQEVARAAIRKAIDTNEEIS